MPKTNYISLENQFRLIESGLKKIADRETVETLAKVSSILAEIRHASVMMECEATILDVEGRLMLALFNKETI